MVRTRFAPSPTGFLHVGGLRTALYAYLYAKKAGGKFILRIEDTDLERTVPGAVELIYRTLNETGLHYDEGPDVGGEYGPYIQTERKNVYMEYARKLIESGDAYYCFCSKERLDKLHKDGATKYDKHCQRTVSREEAERRIAAGEKYVIRQNIPAEGVSSYTDLVFGEIKVDYNDLEDNILIKSDGYPTYNFANVIDDHLMHITHVIRGTEYLSSTPKYNLLYDALGFERPQYIHLQPIMRDAHQKLSKRHGDANYEDFIAKGYLKDAIVNYIALLGWSPKDNREKLTLAEMEEMFSLDGISKSASIFDEQKMRWLNSLYVKELSAEEYHARALPFYERLAYLKALDLAYLSTLLHGRTEVFSDVQKLTEFITKFDGFDTELFVNQKWKTDATLAAKLLPDLIALAGSEWDTLHDALNAYAEQNGYKKGQVLWIFRIALTGAASTPGGATEMATLFGKKESLRRLAVALEKVRR